LACKLIAPGGTPLHVKAVATSSSTIQVSWKSPRKDLTYGQIKGYYVGYRLASKLEEKEPYIYKTLERVENNLDQECVLTGLNKFSKYSIIVQAFNSKGAGPASEQIFVQTLEKGELEDNSLLERPFCNATFFQIHLIRPY